MKQIKFLSILCAGFSLLTLNSCHNQDIEFPDYEYSAVYFAYQTPVRTIVLGEDIYDTSLDNQHKLKIYAAMGGVYENKKVIDIDFVVDNTLCTNLFFPNGSNVVALPSNYYTLGGSKITLDKTLMGAVDVQLTDAFFADPKALTNTYVIPLRMTKVTNADTILSGIPKIANAQRTNSAYWDVLPKDYVLYCVKYINQWHANYLRRGKEIITEGAKVTTNIRHKQYVESDELITLTSLSLSRVSLPVPGHKNILGVDLGLKVNVDFSQDQKCTISPVAAYQVNDSIRVYNIVANGNGEFVKKGEKKSWGNKDRDVLYLGYNLAYEVESSYPKLNKPTVIQKFTVNTVDTLVTRDRGVKLETFSPSYIQ